MTEFDIEYRGVEIPAEVLAGNLFAGTAVLDAFKAGVDGGLNILAEFLAGTPEQEWDYFCDELDPNVPGAYFRRYPRNGSPQSKGEFLGVTEDVWRARQENRAWVENARYYYPVSFNSLPERARD